VRAEHYTFYKSVSNSAFEEHEGKVDIVQYKNEKKTHKNKKKTQGHTWFGNLAAHF